MQPQCSEEPDLEALESGLAANSISADTTQPLSAEELPLVLILIGRVGVGKSSTANALCRPAVPLAAKRAASAVTNSCQMLEVTINGQELLVIDTPGLGDAASSEAEIFTEIRSGLKALVPDGARVCLALVLSFQARVGEAELEMAQGFEQRLFGRRWLQQTLVLWTHMDLLDESGPYEYLAHADESILQLLTDARGGQIFLSNRADQLGLDATYQGIVEKALACAELQVPVALKRYGGGRKAARRQRQVEAGLISEEWIMRGIQPEKSDGDDKGRCAVL